jgi:hypothetical protein
MKNLIIKIMAIALATVTFASCDDETTAGYDRITYYPSITVLGDATILWPKGVAFADPGYYAEMQGEDFTSQVQLAGLPNVNKPGAYTITYSAVNADGFSASAKRTVYVYDTTPTDLASGIYTVSAGSYRKVVSTGAQVAYGSAFDIIIIQVEPGVFYVSDLFGGWYAQRAGYGSRYEMNSYVELYDDNTFELLDSYNAGWGDGMSDFYDASYDPATATISWAPEYVGSYIFYQTITKK